MTLPVPDEGSETGDPENEPAYIRRTGYFLSGRYPGGHCGPENYAIHLIPRQLVARDPIIFSLFNVSKKLSIPALSKQSPVPPRLRTSPVSRNAVLNASL